MKTVFIAPFSMDSLRGTPIRAKTIVRGRAEISDVSLISFSSATVNLPKDKRYELGRCGFFTFTRRTVGILRSIRPDILHGFTTLSVIPMFLYKIFFHWRVKIIYEVHGWAWYEQSRSGRPHIRFLFYLIDLLGLWSANAIVAVSKTYKTFLSKRTRRPERISVIWDAAEFEIEYRPPVAHEGLVVGYIGGAGWWQGLPFIIGAAKILAGRNDIKFNIAGFEPKDEKLFPRLPNISYRGYVERKDVVDFITSCDVMLSTRVEETAGNLLFPLKLAEYMAAGRPIISSGAGDQVEIIQDANCGIVVTPISAEALARAIEKVEAMTNTEREEWGRNALAYARKNLLFPASKRKLSALYQTLGAKE